MFDVIDKKHRIHGIYLFLFLFLIIITACGKKDNPEVFESEKANYLFFLNKDGNALMQEQDTAIEEHPEWSMEEQVEHFVTRLSDVPLQIEWKAPLRLGFSLDSWNVEGTELILCLSESYYDLSPTDEILVRAALVKTLTQVDGIDRVSFWILNEPLKDATGNAVSAMTADCFLDNEIGGMNIATGDE
ncbi:MAG: GerMN domain-containing protein [Lachnospiraceae bacterium]